MPKLCVSILQLLCQFYPGPFQALIWDLSSLGNNQEPGLDPILAYNAGQEINQLQWSSAQPDWVAICFGNKTQILRV